MALVGLSPVPPRQQGPLVLPEDRPVYRITASQGFFDCYDTLHPEGSVLVWRDEPNPEMEPLNAMAREIMKKYLKKLDDFGRAAAEKAGRSYTSMEEAFENSRTMMQQEARRVEVLNGTGAHVPLMGAKKQRNTGKVEKIDLDGGYAPVEIRDPEMAAGKKAVNKTADNTKALL